MEIIRGIESEENVRYKLTCDVITICNVLIKNEKSKKYVHFLEQGFDFYFVDDYFKAEYRLGSQTYEDKICQYFQGDVRCLDLEEVDELLYRLEEIQNNLLT